MLPASRVPVVVVPSLSFTNVTVADVAAAVLLTPSSESIERAETSVVLVSAVSVLELSSAPAASSLSEVSSVAEDSSFVASSVEVASSVPDAALAAEASSEEALSEVLESSAAAGAAFSLSST